MKSKIVAYIEIDPDERKYLSEFVGVQQIEVAV